VTVNLCLFFKLACGVRKTGLQNAFTFFDVGLKNKFFYNIETTDSSCFITFKETKISKINFPTNSSLQFRQSKCIELTKIPQKLNPSELFPLGFGASYRTDRK
jgi:hypothetical protein